MPFPTPALLALICGLLISASAWSDWHDAIRSNQTDTIRALYPQRADVDEGTDHGKTALMAAAAAGDAGLVEALLLAGADPSATNRLGGTVLMYGVGSGDVDTVRRLLETGPPLDARASNGWTAIMMAAAKNLDGLIVRLAAAGANPNIPDIHGWTPLMRATYQGHRAAVAALLDLPRIDPGHLSRMGQNALHLAVIGGHAEMAGALVSRGVDQVSDHLGQTPQSIARELERDDLLALLGGQTAETESGAQ